LPWISCSPLCLDPRWRIVNIVFSMDIDVDVFETVAKVLA
jgi:hypothetical protein